MFQSLLICTDLDDGMQRLVNFVPSLAVGGVQQITFLHSVPLWEEGGIPRKDVEKIEAARQFLSRAIEDVPDGTNVQIVVESGKPIDAICKTVTATNPDIILLGAARRTLLREKLFGSTTIAIAQRIQQIPLLVLRPTMLAAYTSEELDLRCRHLFRYLLIPYDGTPSTKDVLQQLKQYAEARPPDSLAALFLCWVVADSGIRGLAKENELSKARETLPGLKEDLESLNLQVGFDVRQGNPIEETLEAAETIDVSAIAVSTERLGSFLELSGRSLTGEMLRRSFYPVLFFPYQR